MVRSLEEKLQTDIAVMNSQENVLQAQPISGLSLKIKTVISESFHVWQLGSEWVKLREQT